MRQRFLLLFISAFVLLSTASAQNTISGVVKTENDETISSATVVLTDSAGKVNQSTTSNALGVFSFTNMPLGGPYKLNFSSIGFEDMAQTGIYLTNQNQKISLLIRLLEAAAAVNEVVVVAYGTQKQKEITGAIVKISTNDIATSPVTSIDQFIAGKAPGVQIAQGTGAPGSNAYFRIRGVGSITANTQPLIVIDGFPQIYGSNLTAVNLGDIESIEILKDAYATAIYGSRGANGVVLLTTNRGSKEGKTKVEFKNSIGVQSVTKQVALMDAYERAAILQDAANNYWVSLNPAVNKPTDPNTIRSSAARIPEFALPYINKQQGLTNTNWQDVIYRNATIENYQLAISGGTEKSQFYLSGSYLNQNGIIVNSGFKRYTLRFNFTTRVTEKLRVGVNVAPAFSSYARADQGSHKNDGVIFSTLLSHPHQSPYAADGSIALNLVKQTLADGVAPVENPLALANYNQNKAELARLQGGVFAEYDVAKNLTFKTFFSGDYYTTRTNTFHPSFLAAYAVAAPTIATGTSSTQRIYNYLAENTLEYKKSFNSNHNINIIAGYTFQKEGAETNTLTATNYPSNQVTTLNAGTVTTGGSNIEEWSLISYLARVNYNYKLKYLLGVSIRADGSSRFGPDNRWGYFPSYSVGWRIKEEPFLKSVDAVTDMKVRASFGRTGNFFIPNYGFLSLLSAANYPFGNNVNTGLAPSTSPNNNLSWEKTDMFNTGIDMAFFKNKLKITVDYYNSKTKALLLDVPVPAQSGYTGSLQNLGRVQNQGIELAISSSLKIGKVIWNASLNVSNNKNTVLELGPQQTEIITSGTNISKVGGVLGAFYGYQITGVFKNQSDLNKYPHLSTSRIGDYIYADNNGDGNITDKDRVVLGKSQPDYIFGFTSSINYKNFEFSFLLQGSYGYQIYNQLRAFTYNAQGWSNGAKALYDGYFKSETNPGTGFAAPNVRPRDKLYENSNLMLEEGSFIRLRNVSLSYNVPKSFTKKKYKAMLFVAAKNLLTITNYSGYNPEVSNNGADALSPGIDYGVYPVEKNISFGTKISF